MATISFSERAVRESEDADETWEAAQSHVIQIYAGLCGRIEEWSDGSREFFPDPKDAAALVLAISNVVLGAELRRMRWNQEGEQES